MTTEPAGNSGDNKMRRAATERALAASLDQFNALYPTEESCVELVCKNLAAHNMLRCRTCFGAQLDRRPGSRIARCLDCKFSFSITSQTHFHGMKSLRPALAQMFFAENGIIPSSPTFAKIFNLAQSTALSLRNKMLAVIQTRLDGDVLLIPSDSFAVVICKRSRETPARAHPLAEIDIAKRSTPESAIKDDELNHVIVSSLNDAASRQFLNNVEELIDGTGAGSAGILEALSQGPLHMDVLCSRLDKNVAELSALLLILEISGSVLRLPGDRYIRHDGEVQKSTGAIVSGPVVHKKFMRVVEEIVSFISQYFHGISRKYLQYYLAAYSLCFDKKRWTSGSILQTCLLAAPVDDAGIRAYVSPYMVRISDC